MEQILTKQEKISLGIKEIAKKVRTQLKEEFPTSTFSVVIERYSMGQSLHVHLMKNDFKVIRDFEDIPEDAFDIIGHGYTKEQIENTQNTMYHQLNDYTLRKEYEADKWCNGVYLTKEGHDLLQRVVKIIDEYNYDDSDSMTDHFDVNFYMHINIGKYDKPYVLEEDLTVDLETNIIEQERDK